MRHVYYFESWLFADYDKYLTEIGGYTNSMSDAAYDYYLTNREPEREAQLRDAIRAFYASRDIRFGPRHFTHE
jgi:hypothetical protein